MVSEARPAVVRIETGSGSGSGVIFETQGRTGYIVTNHHVVEGETRVTVTVNDSATYSGSVLGTDQERDLAVVSICCGSFKSLPFGNAAAVQPGDAVVAIGYAWGLDGPATVTRGIVSAVRYEPALLSQVIQTDAAINPGNSGGPMLSLSGKILGINTFGYDKAQTEGLNFAISGTTVQSLVPALQAAPAATPTPTRRPTPTPTPGSTGGFGPISGELHHDPSDGFIKTEYAGVDMADITVNATFFNPYSADFHSWDYGFILRRDRFDQTAPFVQVVVSSDGRWSVLTGASPPYTQIAGGALRFFSPQTGGSNTLNFTARGNRGTLWANGEVVGGIDLSDRVQAGDVAVITGAFAGNEVAGAATRYEYFVVTEWSRLYGPVGGTLESGTGVLGYHDSGTQLLTFTAEAEFVSPSGVDWDYGFAFRNSASNRLDAVIVTGNGWWHHYTLDLGDEEYTQVATGRLRDSGVSLKSRNILTLSAQSVVGSFSVNGIHVASLDLSHNLDEGNVAVIGNFFSDHLGAVNFEDFNVWTY